MAETPLHAEAQGLIWAMITLRQRGHRAVHFETDCLQLFKLIQNLDEWPSMVNEVEEIILNSKLFDVFSISHIPRGMNQRADCLAKAARARGDTFMYVCSETPGWLGHVASLLE